MKAFAKQKETHTRREPTCGCQGGRSRGMNWESEIHRHTPRFTK